MKRARAAVVASDPAILARLASIGLLLILGMASSARAAGPTATITLNKTELRAGDTLTIGLKVANPSGSPPADLYVGVIMPDGETALFLVPEGARGPVSLTDSANFRPLQAAPSGFSLDSPAFIQFSLPADGMAIGTYILVAALLSAGDISALDIKPFTYSPRNAFVPMFRKPFGGDFPLGNWFDHDLPFFVGAATTIVDTNDFVLTWTGEHSGGSNGHSGLDFLMPEGTPLLAVADGLVIAAGQEQPFACPAFNNQIVSGLAVAVRHRAPNGDTIDSSYGHLSRVDVQIGQEVVAGQQIGLSGNTGCSGGPHLHFGVYRSTNTNSGQRTQVDPFGWDSTQPDPWAQHPKGAQSLYLWLAGQAPALRRGGTLAANCGTSPCGNAPVAIVRWSVMGVRDDLNPNNELVELAVDPRFAPGGTRDLTGFTLRNKRGDTYLFPAGLVIRENQPIRVHTGQGMNGGDVPVPVELEN